MTPGHDLIVVGASAGGVEALQVLDRPRVEMIDVFCLRANGPSDLRGG